MVSVMMILKSRPNEELKNPKMLQKSKCLWSNDILTRLYTQSR